MKTFDDSYSFFILFFFCFLVLRVMLNFYCGRQIPTLITQIWNRTIILNDKTIYKSDLLFIFCYHGMKWRDRLAIYFGISCGLFASATLDQIVNLWGERSNCAVEPADGYLNLKLLFYA
jgi:hypothetical protein